MTAGPHQRARLPIASADNALARVACPVCKSQERFDVSAKALVTLTDDGAEACRDPEWGSTAHVRCADCGYRGRAYEFSVREGDVLLSHKDLTLAIETARGRLERWAELGSAHLEHNVCHIRQATDLSAMAPIMFTDLRRAFNDGFEAGVITESMVTASADDVTLSPEATDLMVQQALFGQIRFP